MPSWKKRAGDRVPALSGHLFASGVAQAVLVGSTAGHGFEMDDIHVVAHLHAGSLAVPVALAIADAESSMLGRDMIAAVVAGYEVGLRVGIAATGKLFMRGHHFQGTCGTFVAVATAANALRLSPQIARHAFGIAGSFGAGLMAAQEGAMTKRLHAGHAAQMAVTGAYLARRGFTGITNILEAPYGGFLSTLSGEPDLDQLTAGLGEVWVIRDVGFKPYPTAASVQSVLFAIDTLMTENGLTAADISLRPYPLQHHGASPLRLVLCARRGHGGADEYAVHGGCDDPRSRCWPRSVRAKRVLPIRASWT